LQCDDPWQQHVACARLSLAPCSTGSVEVFCPDATASPRLPASNGPWNVNILR
jgi:hypothetical protein